MASFLEGGWILSGRDTAGAEIKIRLTDRELVEAELGVTIGRHPELCDHVLDEPSISRRHFRVCLRAGGVTVEDLNSLNGTLIDGADIPAFVVCPVQSGQRLGVGRVEFELTRVSE
ncbi:MAG: FHA domain-containing protein [Pseudomonadota bacterium]